MILAKKCCFIVSLQIGCIIIAFVGLFLSNMNIDTIMHILNRTYDSETKSRFPAHVFHACLQIFADLLFICASCLLFYAVLSQCFCLFWVTLVFQVIQPVYLILYSIISSAMGKNVIINISIWHNIIYWVYVVVWLDMTLYFIYITFSYYRYLKEKETENVD
ncbi:uncharacterized protein [Drosophila kikkawai]|uniref:Uncharacterized protein n=1 Tax=Drosophila kikkawai TaxID=30033 RepID=A0A6P4JHF0_DROKI|nr:uncharacterized protein LOC108083112 [Drosophila kikkawai]